MQSLKLIITALLVSAFFSLNSQTIKSVVTASSSSNGSIESVRDMVIDSEENITVVGRWSSGDLVLKESSDTIKYRGTSSNGYVASYDSAGNLRWYSEAPSSIGQAQALQLTIDADDNIYVGVFFSDEAYIGEDTFRSEKPTKTEALVIKFNQSGERQWVKQIGSKDHVQISDMEVSDSLLMVVGSSGDSIYIDSVIDDVGTDIVGLFAILKLSDGSPRLGSAPDFTIPSISEGKITFDFDVFDLAFSGNFGDSDTIEFIENAIRDSTNASFIANATDFNFSGRSFNSNGSAFATQINRDKQGNVIHLLGATQNVSTGDTTFNLDNSQNYILFKWDSELNPLWHIVFDAGSSVGMDRMYVDDAGFTYVQGSFFGGSLTAQDSSIAQKGTVKDSFFGKVSPDGHLLYLKTYASSSEGTQFNVIRTAESGAVYIGGSFQNTVDLDGNSINSDPGNADLFYAKVEQPAHWFAALESDTVCDNDEITLFACLDRTFDQNHKFFIEFSDSTGLFHSTGAVDSFEANSTFGYEMTIPDTFENGKTYAVRMWSDFFTDTIELDKKITILESMLGDLMLPEDTSKCEGGFIEIGSGVSAFEYRWSNFDDDSSTFFNNPGENTLTIFDQNGCSATDTINIIDLFKPTVNAILFDSTGYDQFDKVTLTASATGQSPFSYQWRKDGVIINDSIDNTITFDFIEDSTSGVFDVMVSNECGTVISEPADVKLKYHRTFTDSSQWFYVNCFEGCWTTEYNVFGDSLVSNTQYKKVSIDYRDSPELSFLVNENQDSGKVWYLIDDSIHLIMDYTLNVGDTFINTIESNLIDSKTIILDSIYFDSTLAGIRKFYMFNKQSGDSYIWIQGIGTLSSLKLGISDGSEWVPEGVLNCKFDGELKKYESPQFSNGFKSKCDYTIGVFETAVGMPFNIYPNPAKDQLIIKTTGIDQYQVQVFDHLGRELIDENTISTIDVSNWIPGVYVVKLSTETTSGTTKLIIER